MRISINLAPGFLVFLSLCHLTSGFFFPFMNIFNKFRNGGQQNNGGFVTSPISGGPVQSVITARIDGFHLNSSRGGDSNITSIRIPMLSSSLQEGQPRIHVLTTVVSNGVDHPTTVEVHSNISGDNHPLRGGPTITSKLIVPTSTSVTASVSSSSNPRNSPSTVTLPFTPNLFGMMSYVQALKDIKRNWKEQEWDRKAVFYNPDTGDLMTRILRTLIQKVVNKYQKRTELLKLQIFRRQDRLQNFLQLPMVSQVMAINQQSPSSGPHPSAKGGRKLDTGGGTKGATEGGNKPFSILDGFLI